MNKILFMDSDIPSIYFPVGELKDGGTCEFATKKCKIYCPSGMGINHYERFAFEYFKKHNADIITKQIIKDFGVLSEKVYNAKMIQWFVWGDCPSFLTEKIAKVIMNIFDENIPQYGFTRNKKLWELIPKENRLSIGLTVDNKSKALELSKKINKMVAFPDFNKGYANMIFNGKIQSKCNGWWCITKNETRNSDCTLCMNFKEGCYS